MPVAVIELSMDKTRRLLRVLGTQTPDNVTAASLRVYMWSVFRLKRKFPSKCSEPDAEELKESWEAILAGHPFSVFSEITKEVVANAVRMAEEMKAAGRTKQDAAAALKRMFDSPTGDDRE